MKVLVISSKYQPEYSGSGLRAHNTYKRFEKKYRISFDILSNSILYQGNKKYKFDGVDVVRVSPPFKIPLKKSIWRTILIILGMFWEILYSWKFIRKNIDNYNLLHTFGNTWTIGFLTYYFYLKKKPIIRELVNDTKTPYYPVQFKFFFKKVFQRENTLIIAISKKLEELCIVNKVKNIWMRPNPVDENRFFQINKEDKYKLRSKLTNFSKDDIVLLHIASYMKRKNHIFLLDIIKKLPNNYKLFLGGPVENDEHKKIYSIINEKIKELNLEERVTLKKGFVENIDEFIKMCDVFLFPPWNEGLGTPILEAQACGIPIVANSMLGSTGYWIKNNQGGFLVENFNVNDWVDKVKMSLRIDKETIDKNCQKIKIITSIRSIDKQYYEKFNDIL
ncbi:glycosyltransferase family 4 protein [Pelagibacterales bacterium SAG-MED50]|nr:glycosyltransferase family 4 protein [Pelagibacterales bacterium SAG-MED50]